MRILHGVLAALILVPATDVVAQQIPDPTNKRNTSVGTTAAEFLLLGSGARGMALSPAFAALTRDVEALYHNPASLPLLAGPEAALTVMPYFADTHYRWAGFALPLAGGEYGFGVSFANFGFGAQPVYTEDDQENASQRTYSVSETVIGISLGHAFIDRFTGGVTFKLISDQLGSASATAFAMDVGTNYHAELAGRPISMAFVIQNQVLGSGLKHTGSGLDFENYPESPPGVPSQPLDPYPARYETQASPLPVAFRFGIAYDVISSPSSRLSLMGEFNDIYSTESSFGLAGEYEWSPPDGPLSLALRGSYSYQGDNDEAELGATYGDKNIGLDGVVLGGGLKYRFANYEARVDYAWRHFGVLGPRNVFTVSFGWR